MADGQGPDALGWLRRRWERLRPGPAPAPTPTPRVAVVTDSAAALPPEWADAFLQLGCFAVVDLPVMAGDEIFTEGADVDTALSLALAAGRPVRTSRPAPGQFERVYRGFEDAGFEAVVSLHLSGKLSGTADAALLAAQRVGIPVEVVDSRSAAMALGFAVRDAVRAAETGADAEGVQSAALARLGGSEVLFYVPSLEQLRRGGRTAARAVQRLQELAASAVSALDPAEVAVHYFGNRPEAEEFARTLARSIGKEADDVVLSPLPAVLAAHTGLGVLAVVIARAAVGGQDVPADAPAAGDN